MIAMETYGGVCPICGKSMIQRSDKSEFALEFEACIWCGYVCHNKYFGSMEDVVSLEFNIKNLWREIFNVNGVSSRNELIERYGFKEYVGKEYSIFYPTMFRPHPKYLHQMRRVLLCLEDEPIPYYEDTDMTDNCGYIEIGFGFGGASYKYHCKITSNDDVQEFLSSKNCAMKYLIYIIPTQCISRLVNIQDVPDMFDDFVCKAKDVSNF